MALPTGAPDSLSLQQIQSEFGGSNPISLNEYYAGGGIVPAGSTANNNKIVGGFLGQIPSSGPIAIGDFYGSFASGPYVSMLSQHAPGATNFVLAGEPYGSTISNTGKLTILLSVISPTASFQSRGLLMGGSTVNGSFDYIRQGSAISSGADMVYKGDNLYLFLSSRISKYNSSFNEIYERGTADGTGGNIAVSPGNDVIYIGGAATTLSGAGQIIKYTETNNVLTATWGRTITSGTSPYYDTTSVGVDNSDSVYATGFGNMGTTTVTYAAFIIKYNTAGTLQWQRRLIAVSNQNVVGGDDIYVNPSTGDNFTAITAYVTSLEQFIVKYNSAGTLQWQRRIVYGTFGSGTPTKIIQDSSGDIYISKVLATSPRTLYVAKLSGATGVIIWQKQIQQTGPGNTNPIDMDQYGMEIYDGHLFLFYSTKYNITSPNRRSLGAIIKLPLDGSVTTGLNPPLNRDALGNSYFTTITNASYTESAGNLTISGTFTLASFTPAVLQDFASTSWPNTLPIASETYRNHVAAIT